MGKQQRSKQNLEIRLRKKTSKLSFLTRQFLHSEQGLLAYN